MNTVGVRRKLSNPRRGGFRFEGLGVFRKQVLDVGGINP